MQNTVTFGVDGRVFGNFKVFIIDVGICFIFHKPKTYQLLSGMYITVSFNTPQSINMSGDGHPAF